MRTEKYELHHGDCREVMATMADESVDAIVTDPPYGLSFMGKGWDHGVPGVQFDAVAEVRPGSLVDFDRRLKAIAEFAKLRLVNFTRRDRILLKHVLGLTYETSAERLRTVIDRIHAMLLEHPRIANEPLRVRFVAYGPSSLDVELFGYVLTSDFDTFLEVQEEVLLKVMAIVFEAGCEFAFPTQTLHMVGAMESSPAVQPFQKRAA